MSLRLQAATEFMTTFGVTLLIIVVALFILIFLSKAPPQVVPTSCSIYGTLKCVDLSYGTNAVGVTTLEILASSEVQGTINISSFNAVVGGIKSTSGFCSIDGQSGAPTLVFEGNEIYCLATFPNNVVLSQTYTGTFNMSGNYCPDTQSNCPSARPTYRFSGSFRTVGESNSVVTATTTSIIPVTTVATTSSPTTTSPTTSSPTTSSPTTSSPTTTAPTTTTTILYNDIFCVGGYLGTYATNSVYSAPLSGSGIGSWTLTTPYPSSIFSQSCVSSSNDIYCVGGSNGGTIISNVYYAPLSGNGIGAWTSTTPYPTQIEEESCVTNSSYIYCVGGGSAAVYYAPLSSNGVGAWTATTSYPVAVTGPSCSVSGGYIFCGGGTSSATRNPIDNVYSATLSSNGVGSWAATTPYPIATSYNCIPSNGYIYCISSPYYPPKSYYAAVSGSSLGAWNPSTTYPKSGSYEIYLESCVPYNSNAYCVGGYSYIGASYLSNAYYSQTSASGTGTWTPTTSYPLGAGELSCVYGGTG
jgi:hypothetical protein